MAQRSDEPRPGGTAKTGASDPPSSRVVLNAMDRIEEDLLNDGDRSADGEATPPPSSAASDSVSGSLSSEMRGDTEQEEESAAGNTAKEPSEVLRRHVAGGPRVTKEPDLGSSMRDPSTRSLIAARSFRPRHRPPTPIVKILDDDQIGEECIRLRSRTLTIGRLHGDLVFAHEKLMSKQHAEIRREGSAGEYRWVLQDLDSRNGTYVRLGEVVLKNRTRFWIGNSLIKASVDEGSHELTLTEVAQGEAERKSLAPGKYSIGQDAQECVDFLRLSPFLDRNHLRVVYTEQRQWQLSDNESTNGLWVAIDRQPYHLAHGDAFQLGEQRFLFTIP